MKLTTKDQELFSTWLKSQGYSENYADNIPTYYYDGRGGKKMQERAKKLLEAFIHDDTSECKPHGPRSADEESEDVIEFEDSISEEEEVITPEPVSSGNDDLMLAVIGSNLLPEDKLRIIKLLTK